jgi:mRNA interferase MazF
MTTERITLIQAALQQIRDNLQQGEQPLGQVDKKQQLAMAAETLLPDYEAGGELTIFTVLDSEDISMLRGEVWLVNLDPTIGAEIKKTCPDVVVNDDAVGILPLKVIVPITEWRDRYAVAAWMVRLEPSHEHGLNKPSAADAFEMRSVAHKRLIRRRGKLSASTMQEITRALEVVLSIEP